MNESYLLEMRGIEKSFPGVRAVDNVDLTLMKGEVLALVGENGAGKSTLMKILSGAYSADSGEIFLNGQTLVVRNPLDAIKNGITIIYQELNTCETLSVAENILIGNLPLEGKFVKTVNRKERNKKCSELLRLLNLDIDPNTPIARLSIAEKQLIEIAKALSHNTQVLIMDEPTAALNQKEVQLLFETVRKIKSLGTGVIFISHRLDEVLAIGDKIMILRDGKRVFFGDCQLIDKPQIVHYMIGHDVHEGRISDGNQAGKVVMVVEHLSSTQVRDISFFVRSGEVLGVFGLMGSGRSNLVKAIFGAEPMVAGKVIIDGKEVKTRNPREAKHAGIAYIPNDRKLEGLMLNQSVKQNICVSDLESLRGLIGVDPRKEEQLTSLWIKRLNIKTPSINKDVNSLSGGNQQKVVMGKWLATNPKVMILNDPTRGVDVGAKQEIYNIILELCKKGMAVIMISSDLLETLSLADRVLIIHEGKLAAEVEGESINQHTLMAKAVGL